MLKQKSSAIKRNQTKKKTKKQIIIYETYFFVISFLIVGKI